MSTQTVRNHVSAVLTKLQVASRAEAVALARDAGLGPARLCRRPSRQPRIGVVWQASGG